MDNKTNGTCLTTIVKDITEEQAEVLTQIFPSVKSYCLGDGWKNTMGFTFSVNDEEYYLNCFLELEDLAYAINDNLENLDLNAGADDQFFDYSPDQIGGLIQGFTHLINGNYPDDFTEELNKVKAALEDYFTDDHDGNHDNDEEYRNYLNQVITWLNK